LLDDIEGKAVEGEGVLEGDVGRQLVFEQDLAIDCDLKLARDKGEV
jgi:hypothetical protein